MSAEFDHVARNILDANSYLDVFGYAEDSPFRHVKLTYRRLSRIVHPDSCACDDEDVASQVFGRLTELYREALAAVDRGSYGHTFVTLRTRRCQHRIYGSAFKGAIGRIYHATTVAKSGDPVASMVKIAASPHDNDLLAREAKALKRLRGDGTDDRLHPYIPDLIDTFDYRKEGSRRRANATVFLEGFYSLSDVRRTHPDGIHPLDMAWMWRRLLVAIGYASRNGVIHGAVIPDHVMIHPQMHGLVLTDWCYSADIGDDGSIPAAELVDPRYRDWYPAEVLDKQTLSPATDIYLAAKCMVYLLGGDPINGTLPANIPKGLRAFMRGTLVEDQRRRPQDAWGLLREFDELLERLGQPYHPRRFREFRMS